MVLCFSPNLIFKRRNSSFFTLISLFLLATSHLALSKNSDANWTKEQTKSLLYDRCEGCHNDYIFDGNWSVEDINVSDIAKGRNLQRWEAILQSVTVGDMPPAEKKPLDHNEKTALLNWLESSLDRYSTLNPNPGRATLRRLNRSEYANSVRDLLALNIDVTHALPGDDSGYGFDNNADVLGVSTTLLERYLSMAGKLSRLATGISVSTASTQRYLVPKDGPVKNSGVPSFDLRMSDDLPLDSRGGGSFRFYAPITGKYEIAGFINANTNNEVDRLDIHRYNHAQTLTAGDHIIGLSFRKRLALREHVPTVREGTSYVVLPDRAPSALDLDFIVDGARVHSVKVPSYHMSDRFSQAAFLRDVLEIEVVGPLKVSDTDNISSNELRQSASVTKIFICEPDTSAQNNHKITSNVDKSEWQCARKIVAKLAKEAYRRPVEEADISPLLKVFKQARQELNFKQSIAMSIQALLVSPHFLYLQEATPANMASSSLYQISDYEFAARLALFLWSSLPDKTLMRLAQNNTLRQPEVLRQQITRMLQSEKAQALTQNFAGQWLYLRNLPHHFPDVFEFPQFNVPLRKAVKQETELFFTRIIQDNKPIFDFLNADYTYLNEQLAEHYGINGVKGSAFRKVQLTESMQRGGLLGQASILTLTSNPNHTSPVKRGKWILDNLLAASPPPPPPDIPALVAEHNGLALTAREQLARHRKDPVCASCHKRMDPLGLALEKYDAVGAFRTTFAGQYIDVSAQMPDGTVFEGLTGLHAILSERKDRFTHAFIERLLTYALGRGLEAYDQPTVRQIARQSSTADYRAQSIIEAVVTSMPFNYKKAPEAEHEEQQFATAQ